MRALRGSRTFHLFVEANLSISIFFIFWLICGMVAQQPSDKETYDRQPVSTCIESMA